MILSLLMTLEGSDPEVSRLVNVEAGMHLGQLSQVIDAAFGFSGAAIHFYASGSDDLRKVYAETPSGEEEDETALTVGELGDITYIYDPSANWTIHVEVIGETQLDGPTPLLVDAAGPDIVEAANGPEMMTQFRAEARRLAAGLEPNMEVTPLLLSFMPVMSPERILQRLTVSDPVTVATRISFVAEDIYFDQAQEQSEHPETFTLVNEFDDFINSRPDLQAILQDDPTPDRNPTLLAAVAEFFEERMDTSGPIPFMVPPERGDADVIELYPGAEDDVAATLQAADQFAEWHPARRLLNYAGLLGTEAGRGFQASSDPLAEYAVELRAGFEAFLGADEFRSTLFLVANTEGLREDLEVGPVTLDREFVGILEELGGYHRERGLSPDGRALLEYLLQVYGV